MIDLHVGDYFYATSGKIKYLKKSYKCEKSENVWKCIVTHIAFCSLRIPKLNVTHLLTGKHPWSTHGPLLRMVGLILQILYTEASGRSPGDVASLISNMAFPSWLRIFFLIFENIFTAHAFLNVKHNILLNAHEKGFFVIKNTFYFEHCPNATNLLMKVFKFSS